MKQIIKAKQPYSYASLNTIGDHRQGGSVIIAAVIFLLVITILGVSAVKMSAVDTQVAGNSMASMLTYQGAESTLGKAASPNDLTNIGEAAKIVGPYTVPRNTYLPDENISGGKLMSNATVSYEDKHPCPLNMAATSSNFDCDVFRIDATTRLGGSAAKSSHSVGLALPSRLTN